MVDLPELIQLKHKENQAEKLVQLQILIASNNRNLEEKEYTKFIKTLVPANSKSIEDTSTFSRDKLEQLRRRG